MNVFLTGATGFIGIHVKMAVEKAGHTVYPHSFSEDGPFLELPSKTDLVVNCAGRLGGQGATLQELTAANVQLAVSLGKECKKAGIPLIHLSTPGVTGLVANARENHKYDPMGEYESTKVEAEKQLIASCSKLTILRPDFVFGPGDMHKLPLFRQVSRGWFPLVGSGSARTRPTDARDVAEAVLKSFPGEILHRGIYNIGGPDVLTVKQIARYISVATGNTVRLIPVPHFVFRITLRLGPLCPKALSKSRYTLFGMDRFCNTDKAHKKGFTAKRPFGLTAVEAVNWYREKGFL
ncbi:MAG: NAD-dependent epimerase/dehydratase family protein [Candidatus Fermentibacteraceae bacterium]|nr:NAD-dependent epimerase/dehydratase family protein [Candidatus Fermentibacteraceae bacterium]